MKKIGRGGKIVDARPFDSTPDEFADFVNDRWLPSIEHGSHAFHPRGYSLIPHLEREAIAALVDLWPGLPPQPVVDTERPKRTVLTPQGRFVPASPPLNPDTEEAAFERWRVIWAVEAQFRHAHIRGYNLEHRAAINILVTASQLRAAVEDGLSERSAALGMLLAFQALEGGYSLEVETELKDASEAAHEQQKNFAPFLAARGTRKKDGKTALYETYAKMYPGDNKNAVHQLRLSLPNSDDGVSPFYWDGRVVIDKKTKEQITEHDMRSQLQKARQRMK